MDDDFKRIDTDAILAEWAEKLGGQEALDAFFAQTPFASIIEAYLAEGGDRRVLADQFEVSESTVTRWANRVARPHPRICVLITAFIRSKMAPKP
jgi:hypothetical protein